MDLSSLVWQTARDSMQEPRLWLTALRACRVLSMSSWFSGPAMLSPDPASRVSSLVTSGRRHVAVRNGLTLCRRKQCHWLIFSGDASGTESDWLHIFRLTRPRPQTELQVPFPETEHLPFLKVWPPLLSDPTMGTSRPPTDNDTVLITGGGGYFGHRLGCELHQKGVRVILFDIQKPALGVPEGILFIQGDVRSITDLEKAFSGVSCVFHTASYGMSGREQLQRRKIEEINVKGTENVIQACVNKDVGRLVYTSTFNVVFGGQEIKNGDESLPYLPLHLHPDNYSRTKSIAEMKVLKANDRELNAGCGRLKTCALRPAGIYGPGEQRHLPRIIGYLESGLFKFVYGDPSSLVQFVHADNLVTAHVLAAESLTQEKNHVAAGQPYFISDGTPVNNFEFFRPLVEGLGYKFPKICLPLSVVYFVAFVTEWVHFLVGPIYNFQPLLTRTEVYKTGVTHYFSIEKARRDLGYEPHGFTMHEVADWFKSHGYGCQARKVKGRSYAWDVLFVVLVLLAVLSWFPKAVAADC